MKIKYSSSNEVSIEGSQEEMKNLSSDIIEFINSENETISIELNTNYDPSPYENILTTLMFSKTNENEIFITDSLINFSGRSAFFESISESLPYDVEKTPYHIHYDSISFPQFIKSEAPEIVFEATH